MSAVVRPNVPRFEHLLPWEDEAAYASRLEELRASYQPQGPVEQALVERIALLLQRRERLALAERAVHLMAVADAVDSQTDRKRLAERAGVGTAKIEAPEDMTEVLTKSEADDAAEMEELTENHACSLAALAILERGGETAYADALAALDEDGRAWWTDWLEDEQAAETPELHPTAESLKGFIEKHMIKFEEETEAAIAARPALRLQAHGESVDAYRLERIFALDTRLDRQLEKALAMLLKLQEMRGARSANGLPAASRTTPKSASGKTIASN